MRISHVLGLSRRESEIARHVLDDATEVTIASELSLSSHTVHSYIERLYRKLGVSSRCQLVVRLFAAHLSACRDSTCDRQIDLSAMSPLTTQACRTSAVNADRTSDDSAD